MSHTGVALFKGAALAAPVAAEVVKNVVSTLLGEDTNLANSLHDAGYGLAWNLIPGKFIFEPLETILKTDGSKFNYISYHALHVVTIKFCVHISVAVGDLLNFFFNKRKKTAFLKNA